MSHWAELDKNNVVIRVTVGDNEAEDEGYSWLIENLGGVWIKTSYNGSIRKNFAGVGYVYDERLDAFIPPKLYESWILNEESCLWESPVERPIEGQWYWDEENIKWKEKHGE